jgi:hypothetical protein
MLLSELFVCMCLFHFILRAPRDGVIELVQCAEGDFVEKNKILVKLVETEEAKKAAAA